MRYFVAQEGTCRGRSHVPSSSAFLPLTLSQPLPGHAAGRRRARQPQGALWAFPLPHLLESAAARGRGGHHGVLPRVLQALLGSMGC